MKPASTTLPMATYWIISHDGYHCCMDLFLRHYSSKKNKHRKIRQFVGPGEKMVLIGWMCNAVFAWRRARFRADGQTGVECTLFRNESCHLSSHMIRQAMEFAYERWGRQRLFTMVNPRRIRSTNPGYCFLQVGWRKCGWTSGGLVILEAVP